MQGTYQVGTKENFKLQQNSCIFSYPQREKRNFTHKQDFKSPRITKWENQFRKSNTWITIPQRERYKTKEIIGGMVFKTQKWRMTPHLEWEVVRNALKLHLISSKMNNNWPLLRLTIMISRTIGTRSKKASREKADQVSIIRNISDFRL